MKEREEGVLWGGGRVDVLGERGTAGRTESVGGEMLGQEIDRFLAS